jgi:hypothetical protein
VIISSRQNNDFKSVVSNLCGIDPNESRAQDEVSVRSKRLFCYLGVILTDHIIVFFLLFFFNHEKKTFGT